MAGTAPVRIGLIGCGGNQRNAHIPRLQKCVDAGDAVAVAACDPVADNLALAKEKLPELTCYTSHTEMLAAESLDAVVISTPHTLHYRHILDSFAAGCHVLSEKPLVCTVAEAEDVLARRDASGKLLQIGYQRHFSGGYRWARDQILSGEAGPVRFVTAWQCQAWRAGQTRKENSWRIAPQLSGGGQLNDSGSHMVDILLWVTGLQPREVTAMIDKRGLDVDILSAVAVRCDGDAIVNISIVGDSVRQFDEEVVFFCDNMTIQIAGTGGNKVTVNRAGENRQTVEVPAEDMPNAGDPDANFIAAILGRASLEVPGECGLKVIQLSEAAWQSADEGRPVKVG